MTEYTAAAVDFTRQCVEQGTTSAIAQLAHNMARDGYGADSEFREWGAGVIARGLALTLAADTPAAAGALMERNYHTLNHRPSLEERLAKRPSQVGCPILVVHGTLDKAVRCRDFCRKEPYPDTRHVTVPAGARIPHSNIRGDWARVGRDVRGARGPTLCDGEYNLLECDMMVAKCALRGQVTHAQEVDAKIVEWIRRRIPQHVPQTLQ